MNKKILLLLITSIFLFFGLTAKTSAATDVAPHNMTSNVLPTPYVASASSEYDATYKAFDAFDGNNSNYWVSNALPARLELDLGSGNAQTVRSFAIMAGDLGHVTQAPKNFTFEGSNDNSAWDTLVAVTNQTDWPASGVRTFNNTVVGNYRYYRLNVSANGAGTVYVRVAELYIYLEVSPYTMSAASFGGSNGVASQNFTVAIPSAFTGTITLSDGADGGTFNPTSLTWAGTQEAKMFTYTPASIGTKIISVTNNGGLINPTALTYYSTTPYTILPSDLWENAYNTDETDYYLSSPFARLVTQTDARGLSFTVWRTSSRDYYVAVIANGVTTVFATSVAGANTFNVSGLAAGQKTVEIISSNEWRGTPTPQTGAFLKSVEWVGANTTIVPPNSSNRITFYGDSILCGVGTTPPTLSASILVRNHYINRSVLNESWASRELKDDSTTNPPAVKQVLIDNLTLGSPTHIWLGIGVNDYGHSTWSAVDFGLAYADLLDRLHSMLPNTHIIAQTPITQGIETANTFGNTLSDYRNQITTLAGIRPWVTLVSGPSLLTYPTDYSDAQHPNTSGNAKYANEMIPYLDLSNDATLSGLTISSGTLSPTFASSTTSYTDSVPYNITSITVTPTINQPSATVKVNGTTVTSDSASGIIPLNVGSNTITVMATAQDGVTQNTYTVIVTRESDTTAPTITSVTSTNSAGAYKAGQTIHLGINFSEAVTATSTAVLILNTTPAETCAFTVSNSATSTCDYSVQAGDNVAALNVVGGSGTITDVAGNPMMNFAPAANLSASKTIAIDTTAPTVSISSFPIVNNANQGAVIISGTCLENGLQVSLDIGGITATPACSSGAWSTTVDLHTLTDGTITANISQTDTAGNIGSNSLASTKDTVNPTVTGLSNDSTPAKSKTWTWGYGDEKPTFRYAIDQIASWTATGVFASTTTAILPSGNGTYYLHVQAQDGVGNDSTVATVSAILDNTPPVIMVSGDNPATVAQGSAYVDGGAAAIDNTDRGVAVTTKGTVDTATLGDYTITYNATDVAGNAATPATRMVHVVAQTAVTTPAVVVPEARSMPGQFTPAAKAALSLAASNNRLTGQIQYLQSEIERLQKLLAGTKSAVKSNAKYYCSSITKNLSYGIADDPQVRCLQEFLKNQGAGIYPEAKVTGNFFNATKAAVIRFQEKYPNEILKPLGLKQGNGIVGINTRKIINRILAGQTVPDD